jgi:hypothetical protein
MARGTSANLSAVRAAVDQPGMRGRHSVGREMNAPLSERQPRDGEGICEAYAERPLIRAAAKPGHDR